MDYKEILEGVMNIINTTEKSDIGFVNICTYISENCPELKESEDERIRKFLHHTFTVQYLAKDKLGKWHGEPVSNILAWLEKQGTPAKLSEEEQNRFAKGVLTSCAMSFIDYLDAHKYEGKMCVSNGECEDIENAFHNAMWDRLHRYYCKYIEKQGEMDMESYKAAEDEKREFVGDGFIKCYADFQDFKEGETYWLEYVGNDDYNVRSDNLLGKTYHITPCQLYTIFKKMTWLEKQGNKKDNLSVDFVLGYLGIKPAYKDGNAWCILLGDNIQEGICGFGGTKEEALVAFMKELIEKQGEQIPANSAKTCKDDQKPNPYSGTSFDYDGHTWGMCARDNGVELLLDGELKAFLSLEKSFIYPIHPQPELASKSALEGTNDINDKGYCCVVTPQDKSALEATNEEKVDNANKVEPKFKVDDVIRQTDKPEYTYTIREIKDGCYICDTCDFSTDNPLLELVKKKEWSEEDENRFKNLIELVEQSNEGKGTKEGFVKFINRLHSIKNRVQPQPKQEWSEEDEDILRTIISDGIIRADLDMQQIDWLKSLKGRHTWKPSDEQMEALEHFVRSITESGFASPYDSNTKLVYSLLNDLKKLKL